MSDLMTTTHWRRAHPSSTRRRLTGLGAGALVLLGILSMPIVRAGDETSEFAELEEALAAAEPDESGTLLVWAARFRAIGSEAGDARADALARDVLKIDPNHRDAHRQLGHVDFYREILGRDVDPYEDPLPEIVSDTVGYPFIDAYLYFHRKRWLKSATEIRLAALAAAQLEEHARRLEDDAVYRTGTQIRANLAHDARLKGVAFETVWAPPFLVAYVGREPLPDFDPLQGEQQNTRRRQIRLELRRRAKIFKQLYREFFRRYGKTHDLRDLAKPWGGRPDYATGTRSFPDGVPLVVWVFEDAETLQRFHSEQLGEWLPKDFQGGYFMPTNGWVIVHGFGASLEERDLASRVALRGGTLQLLHWFTRQKSRWAMPKPGADFFHVGLAATLSTARVGPSTGLVFRDPEIRDPGLSLWPEIGATAKTLATGRWGKKSDYPIFRLEDLVSFPRSEQAARYATARWGLPPDVGTVLFLEQSAALVTFLQSAEHGRYRDGFDRYFEAVLTRSVNPETQHHVFGRCCDLGTPGAWARLEEAYQRFVQDALQPYDVILDPGSDD